MHSVDIESMDNYALNLGHSQIAMFKIIRDANKPQDILNVELGTLSDTKATKEEKIIAKFKTLGYYNG